MKGRTEKETRGKIAKAVEEEWREVGLLRDIKNTELKSRRKLLAEKQGGVCGMQ